MQDPGVTQLTSSIDYLLTLGARGLVMLFVVASYMKKVRWGYQFDELQAQMDKAELRHQAEVAFARAECAEYKDLAFKLLGHANQATETLAKTQG